MGTIPYANPAGKNQTNGAGPAPTPVAMPGATPGIVAGQVPGAVPSPLNAPAPVALSTGGGAAVTTAAAPVNPGDPTSDLAKQYNDIYGKGVGGELSNLIAGMSGTDSAVFQQYLASLQPQIAKGQADLNAHLGASGVSANSSVAALADANYQSGVIATESGADAQIMQQGLQDTIGIVTGTQQAAEQQVADSSMWGLFGSLAQTAGSVGGEIASAAILAG